jgi:serine/threonine-protein kinase TTK/MPS1
MELGEGDLMKVISNKINDVSSDSTTTDAIDNHQLDFPFIRYWWKEMLQCVRSVHRKDIVHADLKPANFLVVKGGLKLIDFGIAGAIDIENTVNVHRDNHVGTPNYMSPESLQDSSITAKGPGTGPVGVGRLMKLGKPSDVWSLGCILYQMVYGQAPFAHIPQHMTKALAIINPNIEIAFPSTGLGDGEVPPELQKVMKNCLQRDPSKRPTVEQLLSSQDPWLYPEQNKELKISEQSKDLKISEHLLDQIIRQVARRFKDKSKQPPTEDEIAQYAGSFYSKIRAWDA